MEPLTQGAGVQEGGLREQPGDEKEGYPGVQGGGPREQPGDEKEGCPGVKEGGPREQPADEKEGCPALQSQRVTLGQFPVFLPLGPYL